jgi:hypothetical protein
MLFIASYIIISQIAYVASISVVRHKPSELFAQLLQQRFGGISPRNIAGAL